MQAFIEIVEAVAGLALLAILIYRGGVWAVRVWTQWRSIDGNYRVPAEDIARISGREMGCVRIRLWHEPLVWIMLFGVVALYGFVGSSLELLHTLASPSAPALPGSEDEVHPLVITAGEMFGFFVVALGCYVWVRRWQYEISDGGIRLKRWLWGDYTIPWAEVIGASAVGSRPLGVRFEALRPNGAHFERFLVNGFYRHDAFAPVNFRFLGRQTVAAEASEPDDGAVPR